MKERKETEKARIQAYLKDNSISVKNITAYSI